VTLEPLDDGALRSLVEATFDSLNTVGGPPLGSDVVDALVERGVRFVQLYTRYQLWDHHGALRTALPASCKKVDQPSAALVKDLKQRGLLDTTIVWWGGEFGRTPKVQWEAPWNGGRNHHGQVFSALVAGGGFQGGHVVGSSDARGEEVKDRPVYPVDLIGTMYGLLGIDTEAKLPHPLGLPARVIPTPADGVKSAGRLKEIT